MGNDVVFKSKAFGGFDKKEVMDYVNKILEEKAFLQEELADVNQKYAQANYQAHEMGKVYEEYMQSSEKITSLQATVDELTEKNTSLQAEVTELKNELQISQTSEEVQNELEALRSEVAVLKAEAEKKKDLERQVGAAMLDARIHSEELVEEAKEKANAVTKSVYTAIGETALKIDGLSSGIGEIARSFTKSVEEVELRIKALTGDMSKTAQLLITESGVITDNPEVAQQVEYDFTKDDNIVTEISIDPTDYGVENVDKIKFTDDSDI